MKKFIEKNKNLLVGILVALLLIAIIVTLVLIFTKRSKEPEEKIVPVHVTEDDVINTYGNSKEDAINAVKEVYQSDTYEFEAKIRADNKYIVTVTNDDTNTETVYLVEPDTLYYRVLDTEDSEEETQAPSDDETTNETAEE